MTSVFVPRGTVHAFRNPTDDEAKLLITFTRGGLEGFFDASKDLGSPMTDTAAWMDINELRDIQVVGPPLGEESTPPST